LTVETDDIVLLPGKSSFEKFSLEDTPQLFGVNAYLSSAIGNVFELNLAVDQSKQGVVGAAAHVVTRMDVGASLSDDDVACSYLGTVSGLNAQTLGFTVTAVLGRTYTFFMCKEL
jgi:hypothetical protein